MFHIIFIFFIFFSTISANEILSDITVFGVNLNAYEKAKTQFTNNALILLNCENESTENLSSVLEDAWNSVISEFYAIDIISSDIELEACAKTFLSKMYNYIEELNISEDAAVKIIDLLMSYVESSIFLKNLSDTELELSSMVLQTPVSYSIN